MRIGKIDHIYFNLYVVDIGRLLLNLEKFVSSMTSFFWGGGLLFSGECSQRIVSPADKISPTAYLKFIYIYPNAVDLSELVRDFTPYCHIKRK